MEGFIEFLSFVGRLKRLKRSGWLRHLNPAHAESVADHSFGVAAHFLALSDEGLIVNGQTADRSKCMMMALTHDLAESIVGDLTPHDPVGPEEKRKREKAAMAEIGVSLPATRATELNALWEEYEEGKTAEAQLVKDADKYDMIIQAFNYEKLHAVDLEEFFASTEKVFKTEAFKNLSLHLREKRSNWRAAQNISQKP